MDEPRVSGLKLSAVGYIGNIPMIPTAFILTCEYIVSLLVQISNVSTGVSVLYCFKMLSSGRIRKNTVTLKKCGQYSLIMYIHINTY